MLIKVLLLTILAIGLLLACLKFFSQQSKTLFVLDMANLHDLPKRFRVMTDVEDMKLAGGAQFSQASFVEIMKALNTESITVIDLRQEAHGFLNGHAVSWFGVHNADNASKQPMHIESDQAQLLASLSTQNVLSVNRITQKSAEGQVEKLKPFQLSVNEVMSEAEWLEQLGHQYYRLYIQDYHAPEPGEVDRFVKIFNGLPKDQWVYFHCRAGIGRTTVFMAIHDMLLHAKHDSFDDIMDRQVAIGGKDLRKLTHQSHFKHEWHTERLQFLKNFYQYALENNDQFNTLYSSWLRAR